MNIVAITENNWEELKAIRLASLQESPEAFSASYSAALKFSEAEWRSRVSGNLGCIFLLRKMVLIRLELLVDFINLENMS